INDVVVLDEVERHLVVKVLALAPHLLMLLGEQIPGLVAAFTTLLLARQPLLGLLELFLGFAVVTRILNDLSICGDEKYLQANINTRIASGERQRLDRHLAA